MGQLVPNHLPTKEGRNKVTDRPIYNEESHCGTGLECVGEMNAVTVWARFVHVIIIIFFFFA